MNYIKHLTAIFQFFIQDQRLNTTHISLYFALFYYWNWNRFPEIFYVQREEIMRLSKIGARSTYQRCISDLHKWEYIIYLPSNNPFKGSQIKMIEFQISTEQDVEELETSSEKVVEFFRKSPEKDVEEFNKSSEKASVSYINNNKPIKHDKTRKKKEVVEFFQLNNWSVREALKFFHHYEAIGWKMAGKVEIENWQALAEGWMVISRERKEVKKMKEKDNLKTSKFKNYGEPL